MSLECEHTEWIGGPAGYAAGYVPQHWTCTGCNMRITAGEMHILSKLGELKQAIAALKQRNDIGDAA